MAFKIDNRKTVEQATRALRKAVESIAEVNIPTAMDEIGNETIEYSRATKNFNDQTGNLSSGYTYAVLPPNSSGEITWHSLDGGGSETFSSGNEILLRFGNGVFYAAILELIKGYDVSIQTYLELRREMGRMLKDRLRTQKLF